MTPLRAVRPNRAWDARSVLADVRLDLDDPADPAAAVARRGRAGRRAGRGPASSVGSARASVAIGRSLSSGTTVT